MKKNLESLLFFWQTLILAGLLGIIGQQFFGPASMLLLSLAYVDRRTWKLGGAIALSLSFSLGLGLAHYQAQKIPYEPYSLLSQNPMQLPPLVAEKLSLTKSSLFTSIQHKIQSLSLLAKPELPSWYTQALAANLPVQTVQGMVVKVHKLTANRHRIILKQVAPVKQLNQELSSTTQPHQPLPGYLSLNWDEPKLKPLPGQWLQLQIKVYPLRGFRNPNNWRNSLGYQSQSIFWQAYTKADRAKPQLWGKATPSALWREHLNQKIIQSSDFISQTGASLNPALLFGDRSHLSLKHMELMTKAGLNHSLALSGQHLAIVGLLALALSWMISWCNPQILLKLPRLKLIALCSLPLSLGYLWLGNFPISLVRASLMLWIYALCLFSYSPRNLLDALSIALAIMLLYNPLSLYDLGLELSFIAILGIACLNWTQKPRTTLAYLGWAAFMIFSCSLAAQLATLPLTLDAFGRINPWGLLMNTLWLPVLSFWVLPWNFMALGWASLNYSELTSLSLYFSSLPSSFLIETLNNLQESGHLNSIWTFRPTWTLSLAFWLGSLAYLGHKIYQTKRLWVLMLCFSGFALAEYITDAKSPYLELQLLDVGQGQAILIKYPEHKQAIIDAGGFFNQRFEAGRDVLTPNLSYNRWPNLEFVALTHFDRDHAKGAIFISQHLDLKHFYTPANLPSTTLIQQIQTNLEHRSIVHTPLQAPAIIPLTAGYSLEVLAPSPHLEAKGNNGLILRLVYEQDQHKYGLAILAGDSQKAYLKKLLETSQDVTAQVLVLPHHGSKDALNPDFYAAVTPKLALASTGAFNSYHFPAQAVVEALEDLDIPVWNTAEQGAISLRWKNGILQ